MKKVFILLCLGALGGVGHAYERLQGPTQLLYWDKTQTYSGYTFFGAQGASYLLDMEGCVVHTWPVGINPRLLDNGNVLDAASGDINGFTGFEEVDWKGSNVWFYTETRPDYFPHQDFLRIYNKKLGTNTTLYIANKAIASNDCVLAGCNPANGAYTNVTVDAIVEVNAAGTVVWEWCFFDHGIQDYSAARSNYVGSGKTISNYTGRINLNLAGRPLTNDWLHCTSLDYNTNLDQIVITAEGGEFYVIDHGNTFVSNNPAASIALAASTNGDFLYRFGDPARYGQGSAPSIQQNWTVSSTGNKQVGGAGQTTWIPPGVPGEGHFLVFNNGQDLFESTPQSYIVEVNGFLNSGGADTGAYVNPPSAGYTIWSAPGHDTDKQKKNMSKQIVATTYSMANQAFFSPHGGSVQRLPNSNLFVCAASEGHLFEITPGSNVVWEYINPVTTNGNVPYKRDTWPLYNPVYRATRYSTSYPAFTGRSLSGTNTITGGSPSYISAPTIAGVTNTPASPLSNETVGVSATITNSLSVASATLAYIVGTGTNTVTMSHSGSVYGATIPAQAVGVQVRYFVSGADDFGNAATGAVCSYTVQGGTTNFAPVIGAITQSPTTPMSTDPVLITARVTDDVGVSSVAITYSIDSGAVVTNTVFSETMATNAVKPWTGTGCDNVWVVTNRGNNPFQQQTNINYGSGNPGSLLFTKGTATLTNSMITTANGIDARGNSGIVTFYIQTSVVSSNVGWAMQLNPGSGFTTRLSDTTTNTSSGWQLYSYTLQSSDLVSNLLMRFEFCEGSTNNRVMLDQISVKVVAGGAVSSNCAMSLLSNSVYAALIPAQSNGTTVSCVITALDTVGLAATTGFSYQVSTVTSLDTVGDGIPDWWRAQYFPGVDPAGKVTNSDSSAAGDPDGDGFFNASEYAADTDPTNSASRLTMVSVVMSNSDMRFTWIGGSNAWQWLECSTTLMTNMWNVVYTNQPPTSVTNCFTWAGGIDATQCFYRIKAGR